MEIEDGGVKGQIVDINCVKLDFILCSVFVRFWASEILFGPQLPKIIITTSFY